MVDGWFADVPAVDEWADAPSPESPWRPYLQLDGIRVSMNVWFRTEDDCTQFIREEVLGKGMLDA